MGTKRKTYKFRQGDIIDVEEFQDGNYGSPGRSREKKRKPTEEQMRAANARNKMLRCRRRLLEYFTPGDIFATWTYEVKNRPPTMKEALKDFQKAMKAVRVEYKKRGRELFWIRNIEQGTKGAWHIHLVINNIGDTAGIITGAWKKGGTYITEIRNSEKIYDEDFTRLASYMTKDEHSVEKRMDGTVGKPRLKEANYNTSRNMPLPEPKVDKLLTWRKVPKVKDGYYMVSFYEGENPATGLRYRRYTMARMDRGKRGG